jgi:hypothetical protein
MPGVLYQYPTKHGRTIDINFTTNYKRPNESSRVARRWRLPERETKEVCGTRYEPHPSRLRRDTPLGEGNSDFVAYVQNQSRPNTFPS